MERSRATQPAADNTASGAFKRLLPSNTNGNVNTATGCNALLEQHERLIDNTANGARVRSKNNTTGADKHGHRFSSAQFEHHRRLQHGHRCLKRSTSNTTGDEQHGHRLSCALLTIQAGNDNTATGFLALFSNTSGS